MRMELYVEVVHGVEKEEGSPSRGKGEDDLGPLEVMCHAKYSTPVIINSSITMAITIAIGILFLFDRYFSSCYSQDKHRHF